MFRIKKKDKVKVLAGKDRGKTGEVLKVFYSTGRAVVSKIALVKKHKRPTQTDTGGIQEMESSVNMSNLAVICSKCDSATRVKYDCLADGKKVRICKKCGEMIV